MDKILFSVWIRNIANIINICIIKKDIKNIYQRTLFGKYLLQKLNKMGTI